MSKPLHGISGRGIGLPGPEGRYGKGSVHKPVQQTQEQEPADKRPSEQLGKSEPPKQAK